MSTGVPVAPDGLSLRGSAELGYAGTMRGALDKWIADTKDLGAIPERELIAKGLVRDVLSTEYEARVKLHPKGPPVP